MANRGYDLLLIDFDGTLCATRPAILHCLRSTLAAWSSTPASDESIVSTIERGIGLEESFRRLVPDAIHRDPALLPQLVAAYRALYAAESERHTTLFPGWEQTLESLASHGVKTAVVSNKGIAAVHASLGRFGIDRLITLVVGDTAGMPKKPDPAPFEQIVGPRFPTILRHRTLVVGDTDADILFGSNIGAHSCWARYGYGRPEMCAGLSPHYTVDSPREIEPIVLLSAEVRLPPSAPRSPS